MGKIFFPQYKIGREGIKITKEKSTVLDYIKDLGLEIAAECGGIGKCGKCVIRIADGEEYLNEKTELEKIYCTDKYERLACQTKIINPEGNVYVYIKEMGKYQILTSALEIEKISLNTLVKKRGDKIVDASGNFLDVYEGKILGIACDVGTTTIVLQVIDLENGNIIFTEAARNAQISYGNDVMSRIGYCRMYKAGLEKLQSSVINQINNMVEELERENSIVLKKYIYEMVVVGNSAMRDIFFGINVDNLGVIPFEPAVRGPVVKNSSELGLKFNPVCKVYGPPLIGGYIGADMLANIIATGIYKEKNVCMIIDIGTNGEIVIGNRDKMLATSCAAGGTFEGVEIKCGTGAISGAIKNVIIQGGRTYYETINNKYPPVGICGSGMIDLLSELLKNGIMDKNAKLKKEFFICDNISITQEDIYKIITAKAAIRLGQEVLMKHYNIEGNDIEKVYLSGGFGNFINVDNAANIGLLSPSIKNKIVKIGNGALLGAKMMLLSRELREIAESVHGNVQHIKLNELEKDFAYLLAEYMYF
jgi:uncharacterized 2Fe-2S/4Fe-4S cluster protein (DUF4445 family)